MIPATIVIAAPGKAMLAGEYVVLDDEAPPALVAALDRYAVAEGEWQPTKPEPQSPFVEAALQGALASARNLGIAPSEQGWLQLRLDSTALYADDGQKLGLGSSAACTVATVAAVLEAHGLAIDQPAVRAELWRCAHEAHATAQGTPGSGVDVAVAVHGGIVEFRRHRLATMPSCTPAPPPDGVNLRLYATQTPVATAECLARVRQLAQSRPTEYGALKRDLVSLSEQFARAWRSNARQEVLRLASTLNEALDRLGTAAEAPIHDERSRAFSQAALALGVAVKPSGASAAELMVAFTTDATAWPQADQLARSHGLSPLPATVSTLGVHRVAETPSKKMSTTRQLASPTSTPNPATTGQR